MRARSLRRRRLELFDEPPGEGVECALLDVVQVLCGARGGLLRWHGKGGVQGLDDLCKGVGVDGQAAVEDACEASELGEHEHARRALAEVAREDKFERVDIDRFAEGCGHKDMARLPKAQPLRREHLSTDFKVNGPWEGGVDALDNPAELALDERRRLDLDAVARAHTDLYEYKARPIARVVAQQGLPCQQLRRDALEPIEVIYGPEDRRARRRPLRQGGLQMHPIVAFRATSELCCLGRRALHLLQMLPDLGRGDPERAHLRDAHAAHARTRVCVRSPGEVLLSGWVLPTRGWGRKPAFAGVRCVSVAPSRACGSRPLARMRQPPPRAHAAVAPSRACGSRSPARMLQPPPR